MKRLTLIAAVAFALALAGTAAASGDPRVCSANRPAACAQAAAKIAARRHVGGPGGLWQGPSFTCTLTARLKYTCPLAGKPYAVSFVKTTAGWKTTVTP